MMTTAQNSSQSSTGCYAPGYMQCACLRGVVLRGCFGTIWVMSLGMTDMSRSRVRLPREVFVVHHYHLINEDDEYEDGKLIGVFSSEAKANEAVATVGVKPGFVDSPDGFRIIRYVVNEAPPVRKLRRS